MSLTKRFEKYVKILEKIKIDIINDMSSIEENYEPFLNNACLFSRKRFLEHIEYKLHGMSEEEKYASLDGIVEAAIAWGGYNVLDGILSVIFKFEDDSEEEPDSEK